MEYGEADHPDTSFGPIQPIDRPSLREQVRQSLLGAILSGSLPAGSRINETALAERLGVSQTPIREALLGLEERGFLLSQPRKGFSVRAFSKADARDIYPVLAALEVFALETAGVPDAESLAELRDLNRSLRAATDHPERAIERDGAFHRRLHRGCDNRYLLDLMEQARQASYRYEFAYMRETGRVTASADRHDSMLEALAAGDLATACDHLRTNWLDGLPALEGWLESRDTPESS